ncbi:hypothetical protein ABPG72_002595, partial [Tetrahymena utriculariae]
ENQIDNQALGLTNYLSKCIRLFQLKINITFNNLSEQSQLKFRTKVLKIKRLVIQDLHL